MSEDKLQSACHKWFWNTYPELRGCAWHVANERKTNAIQGAILRAKGVVAGVPDYVINFNSQTYYMELKTEIGTTSPAQKKVHRALSTQGFNVMLIRSLEEFKLAVYEIIKPKKETILQNLLKKLCSISNVNISLVKSDDRSAELINVRAAFAIIAIELVDDKAVIAKIINKDRTTLYNYINNCAYYKEVKTLIKQYKKL